MRASLLFFELNNHNFDGFLAGVHVGVLGVGRIGWQPIGMSGFPRVILGFAGVLDNLHVAAFECDDDARMIVTVHGEGRVRIDDRLPDLHAFVFELRVTLRR